MTIKKILSSLIVIGCLIGGSGLIFCFYDNRIARSYGGTVTINVDPGYKVTEATWKQNELWYFIEPMEETYTPKTKYLKESSEYGMLEGKVVFKESR